MLKVKIETIGNVNLPQYESEEAAGVDLRANVEEVVILRKNDSMLIPTGIKIELPKGYEAQIRPRSGLALKHGITVLNTPGTIDSDYRGEIGIVLINHGNKDFIINKNDRIAQMVFNKIEIATFEKVNKLTNSQRGTGGFGHSGI